MDRARRSVPGSFRTAKTRVVRRTVGSVPFPTGAAASARPTTRNRVLLSVSPWMSSARTSSWKRRAARGDRTAAAPRSARSLTIFPAPAVL